MLQIFSDFDGTITSRDSIVFLTEEFGGGPNLRHDILGQIKSRELTVYEAIKRELATVTVSWEEAAQALKKHIHVDPSFPMFVRWCRREGYLLSVLSSGIKPVVSLFIGESGVPFFAHSVEMTATGWHYRRDESAEKKSILQRIKGTAKVVYIGDGTSDVEAIPYVDLLFAKGYLAEHCQQEGIPHNPFQSFLDVQQRLEEMFSR